MGIEEVIYRDAPVDIEPLKAQIKALEAELKSVKDKTVILEAEVEKLKPK